MKSFLNLYLIDYKFITFLFLLCQFYIDLTLQFKYIYKIIKKLKKYMKRKVIIANKY